MWGPALGTKFSPSSCRESCPGPAFLQGLTHARPPGARVAAVLRVVGARVAAVLRVVGADVRVRAPCWAADGALLLTVRV